MAERLELVLKRPQPLTWRGRVVEAVRSYWNGPLTAKDLSKWIGREGPTTAGVSVSEETAMQVSAVWSAVTMISDDIASLPLHLYKRLPNGGKDRYEDHALYHLLHNQPNPEMDSMVWRRTMQAHALLWQNAYSEIERDGAGRPVAVWPLVPERVQVLRSSSGLLFYRVMNSDGGSVDIQAHDMIHLVGYSHDGSVGANLVAKARESLGLALATERFGSSFFGNGATFGGVVSSKGPRPNDQSDKSYREQLERRHQGVDRAHKLLLLYNDASFTQVGVAPNNAQFLETRTFQIREIARWFKMPPHKLGDLADATYSNVEQMDAAYLSSCLRPWLKLWEQQLSRKLISRLERRQQFIEHDTHGFLSVDAAGRAALYQTEIRVGGVTPNEIRGYENRDPIAGGDKAFVSLDVIPLDKLDAYWDAQIKSLERKGEPPPAPPRQKTDEEEAEDEAKEQERHAVLLALAGKVEASVTMAEAARSEAAALAEKLTAAEVAVRMAQQKAEDLSGALAHAEARAEAAEADVVNVKEILGGAETALAAEKAERASEVAELTAMHDAVVARIDEAEAARGVLAAKCESLEGELAQAVSESEVRAAALDAEKAERAAEVAELTAARVAQEERAARAESERDEAAAALPGLLENAAREAREAAEISAAGERQALKAEHQAEVEALQAKHIEAWGDAHERAARLEARFEAAHADISAAEARAEQAEKSLADMTAERDAAVLAQGEAVKDAAAAERRASEAEEARQRSADLLAEGETRFGAAKLEDEARREAEAQRAAAVAVAVRALVLDAMRRLVTKETDRARSNQATPQKLRAWMGSFYGVHADTMCNVLTPILTAHVANLRTDADPEQLARSLADQYVLESRRQLEEVVQVSDFHEALERVLRRWDGPRCEAVADAMLRDGVLRMRGL